MIADTALMIPEVGKKRANAMLLKLDTAFSPGISLTVAQWAR
jgi:hypothetical protein